MIIIMKLREYIFEEGKRARHQVNKNKTAPHLSISHKYMQRPERIHNQTHRLDSTTGRRMPTLHPRAADAIAMVMVRPSLHILYALLWIPPRRHCPVLALLLPLCIVVVGTVLVRVRTLVASQRSEEGCCPAPSSPKLFPPFLPSFPSACSPL
jgi:hypothetical protein